MKKLLLYFILITNCFLQSHAIDIAPVGTPIDLSPAKWIWYPSGRTLQNTVLLFRKEITLSQIPEQANGWIMADSRYRLFVNGKRVQWGPAPSDPRWQEVDPVDLKPYLREGSNVIACEVLYYGTGDGTYPIGKPGFLMNLSIDKQTIVTDCTWDVMLARSWKPGQYKRWYLRALQEEFDARIYPYGWDKSNYTLTADWLKAKEYGDGNIPSVANQTNEYQTEAWSTTPNANLRKRSVPLMREMNVKVAKLEENHWLKWNKDIITYFDMNTLDAYEVDRTPCANPLSPDTWEVESDGTRGAVLTYSLPEGMVGFSHFTIDAPEGTIIELITHEAHEVGGPPLINNGFNAWSRFICRKGMNRFETFDYDGLRWIQLHIHNFTGKVTVSDVGVRRRIYDWKRPQPKIVIDDPTLQQVMDANINTMYNCAQEIIVDGMFRERQQYSGDGAHQVIPIYYGFGDYQLPARYISTFSQGCSKEGYFMDSWPAYDRLSRLITRQLDLADWGPILDHGVQFCIDNYTYYTQTGDTLALRESYPRLIKFFRYLQSLQIKETGLLPIENIGVPCVWMDHDAYKKRAHKHLSFNLYVSGMCSTALNKLAEVMGNDKLVREIESFGRTILNGCIANYWCSERKVFVDNKPWEKTEGEIRYSDRSLAMSVLFDQCPDGATDRAIEILATVPNEMGLSYPCNSPWRYWALIKARRINTVLDDLRNRWAAMPSIQLNNTIQEYWVAYPDGTSQWSHSAVAPLIALYHGVAGVRPLSPGAKTIEIAPQIGDLKAFEVDVQTFRGAVLMRLTPTKGKRELYITLPQGVNAELILPADAKVKLPIININKENETVRYRTENQNTIRVEFPLFKAAKTN